MGVSYEFVAVWSDGKHLHGEDFDETVTFAIEHGEARVVPAVAHEWRDDKYKCARAGTSYTAFNHTDGD